MENVWNRRLKSHAVVVFCFGIQYNFLINPPLPFDSTVVEKGDGMNRLILASSSPRRKALLSRFFHSFLVVPSTVTEQISEDIPPEKVVQSLAWQKANDVKQRYPNDVVLALDTVVFARGKILGKPQNKNEARKMLSLLSGNHHQVFTGVVMMFRERERCFTEMTDVYFRPLSEREISAYINTAEPYDKAGAYGIQGTGALFVKKIAGDFYNVVGLPLSKTVVELRNFGIDSDLFTK